MSLLCHHTIIQWIYIMFVFSIGVRLSTCSLQIQYCYLLCSSSMWSTEEKWGCGIISSSSDTEWCGLNAIHLWQLVAELYINLFIDNARQSGSYLYFNFIRQMQFLYIELTCSWNWFLQYKMYMVGISPILLICVTDALCIWVWYIWSPKNWWDQYCPKLRG